MVGNSSLEVLRIGCGGAAGVGFEAWDDSVSSSLVGGGFGDTSAEGLKGSFAGP